MRPDKGENHTSGTRRKVLKTVGSTAAALSSFSVVGAADSTRGDGESVKRKPTKEERRLMEKKRRKAEAEAREDSKRQYQATAEALRSGVSTLDIVGEVPTVGCSNSYGSNSATWVNGNSSTYAQVGSFTNSYTVTDGVTNKSAAICDALGGDDLWAWSEVGLVFDAAETGRLNCTAQGYVSGQNFAVVPCSAGVADGNTQFYLLGYNLTDGQVASGPSGGTTNIEQFGVDLFGTPKNVNRDYAQTLKLDVEAGKRYLFVAKVRTTSFAVGCAQGVADADEKYNALVTADWDGYHQMYNMGLSYNSC